MTENDVILGTYGRFDTLLEQQYGSSRNLGNDQGIITIVFK